MPHKFFNEDIRYMYHNNFPNVKIKEQLTSIETNYYNEISGFFNYFLTAVRIVIIITLSQWSCIYGNGRPHNVQVECIGRRVVRFGRCCFRVIVRAKLVWKIGLFKNISVYSKVSF